MSRYRIEILDDEQKIQEVEDKLLDQLRVFQRIFWLKMVGDSLKAAVCYDENGILKGYLPVVHNRRFRINGFHIPPYTPYFGPLITEKDLFRKMDIIELLIGSFLKESHLDFVLPLEDGDVLPYIKLGFSIDARQTHIIPLEHEYGINQVHSSKKRYLKKLIELYKKGEIIAKKGAGAVPDLMALNEQTEARAGFRGRREVLEKLVKSEAVSDESVLVLYDQKGTPLAGAFCPRDTQYAYHLINASARNEDSLLDKANLLSAFMMVEDAKKSGLGFDFEGSNISGVANFYRMMGGQPRVNFRMQKSRSITFGLLRAVQSIRKEHYAN